MPANLLCDALFHHCARLPFTLCIQSTADARQQCGSDRLASSAAPEAPFIICPIRYLRSVIRQSSGSEELKHLSASALGTLPKKVETHLCLCPLCSLRSGQFFLEPVISHPEKMTLSGTPDRDDGTHLGSMFRTSACISMFLLCRVLDIQHLLLFFGRLLFFSPCAELLTENWRVFFFFFGQKLLIRVPGRNIIKKSESSSSMIN